MIISGSGALHVPKLPNIPGIDTFQGDAFHTALWKAGYEPEGKDVAVIGTGASAVQAVPNLAKMGVKSLTVFQRTACWSPPRLDYEYSGWVKQMFYWIPFTNILHRYYIFCINELRFWMIFATDGIISKVKHRKLNIFARLLSHFFSVHPLDNVSADSQARQKTHFHGGEGSGVGKQVDTLLRHGMQKNYSLRYHFVEMILIKICSRPRKH